ncbi:MAG TPA: hypothetical protein VFG69_14990 [Nannocystaceae bacterium]|nr:hypothetical protein [Nannocystaceae bacterium]
MGLAAQCLEQEVLRLPWRAVLNEPLVVVPSLTKAPAHSALAAVPLLGTWSGWITVRCDMRLAHEIASRLRGDDLVCAGDVENATRWLAGAIASALQPAVDPQARLGPATVLDAQEPWAPRWCQPAARLLFASGDRVLGVALDERMALALRRTAQFESDLEDAGPPAPAVPVEPVHAEERPVSPPIPISRRRSF